MTDNAIVQRATLLYARARQLVFLWAIGVLAWAPMVLYSAHAKAQEQAAPTAQSSPSAAVQGEYGVLADALANDKIRTQLVEQLRQLAAEEAASGEAAAESTDATHSATQPTETMTQATVQANQEHASDTARLTPAATADASVTPNATAPSSANASSPAQREHSPSFVSRLQAVAHGLRADVAQTWHMVTAWVTGERLPVQPAREWQSALRNLALTILAVVVAFVVLRRLVRPIFRRFDRWAERIPTRAELAAEQAKLQQRHQQQVQLAQQQAAEQAQSIAESDQADQEVELSSEFAHLQTKPESEPEVTAIPSLPTTEHLDPNQAEKNYVLRYRKLRKLAAVVGALAVDVLALFLAAVVGYVVAMALPDPSRLSSLLSVQLLTAFVMIETTKALSRGVFATGYEQLRLLPINDASAAYWNRWICTVVAVGGYGLLVAVPALQTVLSASLANVTGAVLMLVVYLYAIGVLIRRRQSVTQTLLHQAEHSQHGFGGTLLRIFARLWFWLAMAYFTVLFIATQLDQGNALYFMAAATGKTLLTVLIGGVLSLLLTSLASHPVHLPERWNQNFPLLEARINSYIPAGVRLLRLVVIAAVLLSVFDAWRVFDLREWVLHGHGQAVISTVIRVVVVLFIAALLWTVLASVIEHRLSTSGDRMPSEREKTLLMLFRNALSIVIITFTVLIVLSQVGIDIGPLIAGAGVVGLAIGFGAQKLVQDVITGIFIQLENGMNQNDVVEVVGLFGVVEKLTVRSVVIRTLDGGYHLIPFSSIDKVSNHTRDYGFHYHEYCVALRESSDEVCEYFKRAFDDLKQDPKVADAILDEIAMYAITSFRREGFTIRVLIKTKPGMQWQVGQRFNRLVKFYFDSVGIELPYPQTVLHFGRDKNGYASPVETHAVEALAQAKQDERATAVAKASPEEVVYAPGQTHRPFPDDPYKSFY